jgi:CheY-like chemotaxis protein
MNQKPKILVVDDEPFNVDYLEQELADLNYDTVSAGNGQEALEKLQTESPDLVLLDIMMPVMDGFAVLARLKANPKLRDIPVIIISAMNDLPSVVKGIEQGAEDYLSKPFERKIICLNHLNRCSCTLVFPPAWKRNVCVTNTAASFARLPTGKLQRS